MISLGILQLLVGLTYAIDYPVFNNEKYCLLHRQYSGLGNYMEQILVYKLKKKLPEMHQYSIGQITNLSMNKLVEKTYRPAPYKSNKVISLIHKEVTPKSQKEIDFIYKKLLKKDIEGTYIYPCPYILREKFNL